MTARHTRRQLSPYSPAMQLLPQCSLMAAASHFSFVEPMLLPLISKQQQIRCSTESTELSLLREQQNTKQE